MLTASILRDTLTKVRGYFLVSYETTWDINNGGCEDFAREVFRRLGGETDKLYGIWLEDLDPTNAPNHYAIFWNGRWYDAECIDGVKDWRDLPITLNMGKSRAEVLADRELEEAA